MRRHTFTSFVILAWAALSAVDSWALENERANAFLLLTDNGYNCGSHGFGGKVMPYEEGSRSPIVIYDRHFSPDDKLAAMDNRMRRKYLEWRKDSKTAFGDGKPKKEKNSRRERKPKEDGVRKER